MHQVLVPSGEFLFKTDHLEYHEWVLEQVVEFNKTNPQKTFDQLAWPGNCLDDGFLYPKTDFQRLWEGEGITLKRLIYMTYHHVT